MRRASTTLEPKFCISVNHSAGFIDDNAIKAVLMEANRFIANQLLSMSGCVVTEKGEVNISSVAVTVKGLDIDKKPVNLKTFGTDDVPLTVHCQCEFQESEAEIQLRAWQEAFGTNQLTHALARLQSAEKKSHG